MYQFRMAPLPKPVFTVLKEIAAREGMTQRGVVVAGILALVRLRNVSAPHSADVLEEARKLCPRRDGSSPTA